MTPDGDVAGPLRVGNPPMPKRFNLLIELSKPSPHRKAVLFMLATALLIPAVNADVAYLSHRYPVAQLLWARYAGHLGFMLLFFVPRRGLSIFQSTRPGLQASRSAIFCVGSFVMFYALGYVPVATATAVSFTAPLIVTALSPHFLKETVRRRNWAAVLLGFLGTLIIVRPGIGGMHPAALLILISALGSATTQVMSRKLASHDSPETSNLYMASVGFFLSSLFMPWVWTSPNAVVDAVFMSALGLFGGCGHYCLVRAFEIAPAPFVAPFNYAQIVGAALLGFICFRQIPDAGTLMGTCIIVISGLGALSTRQRSSAARA